MKLRSLLPLLLAAALAAHAANDPKAARFYEDALARYEKKDLKGAIIQLKNALQVDNGMLQVHLLLGRVLLADGQPTQAEVAFSEALKLGVNRTEVIVDLAQSLVDQGKQPSLLTDERFVASGLPKDVLARLLLLKAAAAADIGNVREAYSLIDQARASAPRSADPWIAESGLRIREHRFDLALAAIDRAAALMAPSAGLIYQRAQVQHVAGKADAALALYGEALKLDPGHVESLLGRAGLLIDLRRGQDARRDVAEVRRLLPDEPRGAYLDALLAEQRGEPERTREALKSVTALIDPVPLDFIKYKPQMLMLNGLAHYGLGEREAAKPYLEAFQKLDPGGGVAKLLARIQIAEGNIDAAIGTLEGFLRRNPTDAQAQALLASAHMAKGRPARAISVVREALKAQDTPELRAALGMSLLRTGQSRDALAEFESIHRANPQLTGPAAALAGLYLQLGEPKKALEITTRLVKQEPGNAGFLTLQGHARLANGDGAGAGSAFAEAARKDPSLLAPQMALARLDSAAGRHDAAIKRLSDALATHERNTDLQFELAGAWERRGRADEAQRWLEKAIESAHPRDFRPAIALVDLHLRQNRPAEALAEAKRLASKAPNDLSPQMTLAKMHIAVNDRDSARLTLTSAARLAGFDPADQVEIGLLQQVVGNREGATYSFDKALSARPDYLPAQAAMTDVEIRAGELAKAEARAKAIVQAHPKLGVGYSLLGDVAWARGAAPAATEQYRKAHQLSPSNDTLMRLANALRHQQGLKEAIALVELWLEKHPNDRRVRAAQAEQLLRTGDAAGARRHYERILRDAPKDAEALNNLANVLLRLDKAAAIPIAERAVAAAPGNASVLDTQGWVLLHNGQVERALQILRDARLRQPGNPEIRYHLGAALAKTGRHGEARTELQAALAAAPRFEGSEEARELLKSLP